MKRFSLFIIICVALLSVNSNAQVIFEDNFESYGVGDYIADNSDVWTTWSNAPGGAEDAVASDAFANSPNKSMHISGTSDMVLPMGNKTSGKYNVNFYIYVENDANSEGYFNLQHFEAPGTEWALEVYFNLDATGHVDANGESITFDYTQGAWVFVETIIDIDADEAMIYIDGALVHTWPFATQASGGAGAAQLGGMNVYAGAETGTANFYTDDVVYESVPTSLFFDDFEDYEDGAYVAENSDVWTTWSDAPGTAEDAVISSAFSNSPTQSMHVSGTNDMLLPLGNKTSGQFWVNMYMYVENDGSSEGYFNLQHFEAPGTEWACEVFFLLDGTGTFEANGETTTFNYTQDSWVLVENYIDINADSAAFYIDGEHIVTWPFATQASGGAGTAQLGAVNIYAGADTGTPNFYVDDVDYLGSSSLTPATIDVSTSTILTTTGDDEMFTVGNVGEEELTYSIYPVYPDAGKALSLIPQQDLPKENYIPMSELQAVRAANTSNAEITRDGTLTHVQSAFGGGVGYGSEVTVRAATVFEPADVAPYIGMEIASVLIGINDLPLNNEGTLMIWNRGSFAAPGPGALIMEKDFTVSEVGEQVLITLDDPIYIDGNEIWVGYQVTDPGDGFFPLGIDEGPRVEGVNFLSTGPGWGEMHETIDGNLYIVCNLEGDGAIQWMSAMPEEGTLAGGEEDDVTVSFDDTDLTPGETYTGKLMVKANDAANEYTQINVSFIVPSLPEYTLTFNVTDQNSNPIENATVTINESNLNTNALGIATIEVQDGEYPHTVVANGYYQTNGTVTVSGADLSEDITLNPQTAPHFTPIWSGNPLNPMTVTVSKAELDALALQPGDEVAVFDGDYCVGAEVLQQCIDPNNSDTYIYIACAQDDPDTPEIDGFTVGNTVSYRVYDQSEEFESSSISVIYPYAPAYAFTEFTINETSVVELSALSSITQTTDLISGWNLISWNVSPEETDIQNVLQALIDNNNLVKVIDQNGDILQHMPWGWVNNIGDMCNPEGYQIKVNTNCQLSTSGSPVELPINVPLISGYNLMGWPAQTAEDAETALADLITAGYLVKVINESGDILQHMPWGWVNNIGDLEPGEGYQVKVNSVCTLVVDEPAGSGKHSKPQKKLPKILRAENESNPYNPMAFAIALNGNLPIGAEVGVFMDGHCLDAVVVEGDYLYLAAGSDDAETMEKEGFSEGEKFIIRYQTEAMSQPEELPLSYLEGDEIFAPLGTFVGELKESLGVDAPGGIALSIYPNPVKDQALLEIQNAQSMELQLSIFDIHGSKLQSHAFNVRDGVLHQQVLDLTSLAGGIYYVEIRALSDANNYKKTIKIIKTL